MTVSAAGPYRPDIDGLRAVAVVAVVLFHAHVPGFTGGYVGVDVFFVLSGYLITAQLLSSAGTPVRSMLAQFYLRRARRILPALCVVLAVVLVAAAILFLPDDLERLGRAATLSMVFAGNIAAWRTGGRNGGYFDPNPDHAPLLHLWTIGIEEQFYLFFPLFLWIALRYFRKDRLGLTVGLCALASFAICVWGAEAHPQASFYLAPTRAWELLLGAMLAVRAPRPVANRLARELLAAGAAATIFLTIFFFDGDTKYPYFSALAPCAATAVLIASGLAMPPLTTRVLALRPVVFIGLVSYSLYLWHVPVQTMFEYYSIRELTAVETVGSLSAAFLLAVASWAFIEKPVRERRLLGQSARFIVCMAVVAGTLAAVGAVYWRSAGLPQRIPESLLAVIDGRDRFHHDAGKCMTATPQQIAAGELCHYGSSEGSARRFVVWGDSHAVALLPALELLAMDHGASLYFAGTTSCRPLIGVVSRRRSEAARRKCDEYNAAMLEATEKLDPAVVILASYWTYPDVDLESTGPVPVSNEELFATGLRNMLDRPEMQSRAACAVLDVPRFDFSVPNAYGRAVRRGIDTDFLAMDRAKALQQLAPAEDPLKRMRATGGLRVVDPKQLLCTEHVCRSELAAGELLYGDDNHLSVRGARFVAPALELCFQ